MNGACNSTFFLPHPLGPWGRAKRSNINKYHKISITKSISKIFKPNFVCLLTNERYETYQMGFSFGRMGHAPGVRVGLGSQNKISEIQPDFVCELLTWMAHATAQYFGSPPPGALGGGQKVTKLCVSSHKWKIYNISDGIFIRSPGSCPGVGLEGTVGDWESKFFFFSEIQPDFMCELLTRMAHASTQFFWSPPPGALGRGQKFNFLNMVMCHIKLKGKSRRPRSTEKF